MKDESYFRVGSHKKNFLPSNLKKVRDFEYSSYSNPATCEFFSPDEKFDFLGVYNHGVSPRLYSKNKIASDKSSLLDKIDYNLDKFFCNFILESFYYFDIPESKRSSIGYFD